MNLEAFLEQHRLPDAFVDSAKRCYFPVVDWLVDLLETSDKPLVLGINGAQGTGKSTLAHLLADCLEQDQGKRVAILSIDDIYLTRAEREALADDVHPMFATRGVPGTHDVSLGINTIEALRTLAQGQSLRIPRFDKSIDDRFSKDEWTAIEGPVDLVIFEGWCIASTASADYELTEPMNTLESDKDGYGLWRHYVNEQLKGDYKTLFDLLDSLVFLKAPDFDCVYRWRLEQEHKLRDKAGEGASGVMSDDEIAEFIQYYERITRRNLDELPGIADVVIELAADHSAVALDRRS